MEESELINYCKELIIKTFIRDVTSFLELITRECNLNEVHFPLNYIAIAFSELEKEGKIVFDEGIYYILNPDKGFKNS